MKPAARRSWQRNNPGLPHLVGVYWQEAHERLAELEAVIFAERHQQPWAASPELRAFMADIDKRGKA